MTFAGEGMWQKFWTLFGASNQLLAALTLLSITVWLHQARRRIAFTLLPMIFVLTITLWALGRLTYANLMTSKGFDVELLNGIAALLLILLALYMAFAAVVKLRMERKGEGEALPA
jgi:carbon starvation protein